MHDGRARTLAEAVLWHDGEGRAAKQRFVLLGARERSVLLDWVASR